MNIKTIAIVAVLALISGAFILAITMPDWPSPYRVEVRVVER